MLKFSEKLLDRLNGDIANITGVENDPFKKLSLVLKAVRRALSELKAYVAGNPFKDKADEVHFFKQIKPQFYCLRIFYLERYTIETSIPAGDTEAIKAFLKEELKTVQRFFRQIYFHYQYYRLGATELDELYFVRGVEVQSVLIPEVPEPDPEFSTSGDYLFSKIKAYELLQGYLLKRLQSFEQLLPGGPALPGVVDEPELSLKWTGDKVNLVEVIYALHCTLRARSIMAMPIYRC